MLVVLPTAFYCKIGSIVSLFKLSLHLPAIQEGTCWMCMTITVDAFQSVNVWLLAAFALIFLRLHRRNFIWKSDSSVFHFPESIHQHAVNMDLFVLGKISIKDSFSSTEVTLFSLYSFFLVCFCQFVRTRCAKHSLLCEIYTFKATLMESNTTFLAKNKAVLWIVGSTHASLTGCMKDRPRCFVHLRMFSFL